ncbi:MAG: replication-relaxation family protein [Rhizomicrobium sp.]
MATKRRPRTQATRSGKRIELTDRDLEIFRALRRYRYLSSTYLHAFVGGASATRLKERLGNLFHEGYLDRPAVQWEQANCRYRPAVYECGAGARRVLAEAEDADDARTFLGAGSHKQFLHSLMICEMLASIELAARARPSLRFIAWPEILQRAPADTRTNAIPFRIPVPSGGFLVPDGLFGLEYGGPQKSYRFFALEADRGTMPVSRTGRSQTSLLGKLEGYRSIIAQQRYKAHWGVPNLLVLTVTSNAGRLARALQGLEGAGGSPALLFRTATGLQLKTPVPSLLEAPWERAALPPIRIDGADQ